MTNLAIFDFDGTLFRSPDRPSWWDDAMNAVGSKRNWWANAYSLNRPCVPDEPGPEWWVQPTVRAAKKAISDPDTWAILMTGRAEKFFRYRVPELLKQAGLNFDEVHLNPGMDKGQFKRRIILERLARWPDIDQVDIWDDDLDDLKLFVKTVQDVGRKVTPHPVRVQAHDPACELPAFTNAPDDLWFSAARVARRYLQRRGDSG